jgi:thioredoxin reductase
MEHIPVLIIGASPAGTTLALHLGKQGVKSIFISRHRGTANTPRAHIFNQRAMEVLRDAGAEDKARAAASPAYDMQHTSWSNTLSGEEYGRMWVGMRQQARRERSLRDGQSLRNVRPAAEYPRADSG